MLIGSCQYSANPLTSIIDYYQDFDKDALEKFIEVSGFPMVVTFDADPTNIKFLERYYSTPSAKVSKNIAGCGFFFLIWRT
jgi:hypothetical protein